MHDLKERMNVEIMGDDDIQTLLPEPIDGHEIADRAHGRLVRGEDRAWIIERSVNPGVDQRMPAQPMLMRIIGHTVGMISRKPAKRPERPNGRTIIAHGSHHLFGRLPGPQDAAGDYLRRLTKSRTQGATLLTASLGDGDFVSAFA